MSETENTPAAPEPEPELSPAERLQRHFEETFLELLKDEKFRAWLFFIADSPEWCAAHAVRVDVTNPNQTYLDAGKREVGVQLLFKAQLLSHQLYIRMLKEQHNLRASLGAFKKD